MTKQIFHRTVTNGIKGILTEILLTLIFMLAGLVVCLLWWGLFK